MGTIVYCRARFAKSKRWDGRGHLDTDESFEETKEAHIEMARRRVNIHHYLLTLIEKDDK